MAVRCKQFMVSAAVPSGHFAENNCLWFVLNFEIVHVGWKYVSNSTCNVKLLLPYEHFWTGGG
jgi:hypothetical protein